MLPKVPNPAEIKSRDCGITFSKRHSEPKLHDPRVAAVSMRPGFAAPMVRSEIADVERLNTDLQGETLCRIMSVLKSERSTFLEPGPIRNLRGVAWVQPERWSASRSAHATIVSVGGAQPLT